MRLPDHQLSLFHGHQPEALQVNVCDVDGCEVRHGGTGPCIQHLAAQLRALNNEADALGLPVPGRPMVASRADEKAVSHG